MHLAIVQSRDSYQRMKRRIILDKSLSPYEDNRTKLSQSYKAKEYLLESILHLSGE